jgi:tetratricopeptide (TPR) repeat protein
MIRHVCARSRWQIYPLWVIDISLSREPTALYLIGWCYNGLGQYAEAIEPFRQSLALDHTAATVPSELGYAYRQLKRYPEAKVVYAQALEIDPKFAPALHGLGLTALALGDKVAAQQQLQILNGLDKTWADRLAPKSRNSVTSAIDVGAPSSTRSRCLGAGAGDNWGVRVNWFDRMMGGRGNRAGARSVRRRNPAV